MSGLLDTQNKQWAEDKTKFGYRMMQKMGWTDGKGLGVKEDGATEHLRVRKKLTTAGVGAISSAREQWNVPAELASGLDDVLARLSAAAPVGAAARPAAGAVASGGDGARARGNKGFFGRRIAGKNVGAYSAEALKEIFGGAPVAMAPRAIAAAEGETRKGGDLREEEEKKGRNEVERLERAKRKEERAKRREEKMLRRARRAEKERSKLGVAKDGPGISKERKSSKKKGRRKGEDGK
jgi:Pin2-interacting protein X1